MKTQYQQIRDILEAVHYPVDHAHETAFMTLLLEDKKRRTKNLLWFLLCCLAMVVAGFAALAFFKALPSREKPAQERTAEDPTAALETATLPGAPSTTADQDGLSSSNPSSSTEGSSQSSQISTGISATNGTETSSQVSAQSHSSDLAESQSSSKSSQTSFAFGESASSASSASSSSSASSASSASGQKGTKSGVAGQTNKSSLKNGQTTSATLAENNTSVSSTTSTNTSATGTAQSDSQVFDKNSTTSRNTIAEVKRITPRESPSLQTTVQEVSSDERKIADAALIIPANRRVPEHLLHYGITGAWFPTGQLLTKSNLKTGYGFQLGGYATYRITPRFVLRADGGFSRLDGGFSYIKESDSQQYGFSLINQSHSLEIEQLYAGYLSSEIGVRRGKNTYCIGVLGQFLYGARGDIESLTYAQDAPMPIIVKSDDVWLTTSDMHKVSLHGSIGMRSRVTRRLEFSAMLRIPITNTLRKPSDLGTYDFQVQSHGITPHIMMSYQINQQ